MENCAHAFLYVQEEVVDESLDVVSAMWVGESSETNGEKPYVKISNGEPRLKSRRKVAFCKEISGERESTKC